MVVPFGLYLSNHMRFGERLRNPPRVFSTNYFIKGENDRYLNEKVDKKVWVIWAEGRVHGEYGAIETPVGYIPRYKDLRALFRRVFDREYTLEEYTRQFSVRVDKYLEKQERIEKLYGDEDGIPDEFWAVHRRIKKQLKELREKTSEPVLPPSHIR